MNVLDDLIWALEDRRAKIDHILKQIRQWGPDIVEMLADLTGPGTKVDVPTPRPKAPPPAKKTNGSALRCPKCGTTEFTRQNGLAIHLKTCDGVLRTKAERIRWASQRFHEKRKADKEGDRHGHKAR